MSVWLFYLACTFAALIVAGALGDLYLYLF